MQGKSSHYHLAQVNVARMLAPIDSPLMADFVAQIPAVNQLAEQAHGFVWRLVDATGVQAFDDPLILINLSVWESVEALQAYAYQSGHLAPLRDRTKWFELPRQAHLAMWWIPAGHTPGVEEAVERLDFRRSHGDTAVAFAFAKLFSRPDEPEGEPVPCGQNLDGKIFVSAGNTSNGDVSRATRFHYRQSGGRVWATYRGGGVRFGHLVANMDGGGRLDMRYQHADLAGAVRTGTCRSTPAILPDGRMSLVEEWQWTNGDLSEGSSVVEEVRLG